MKFRAGDLEFNASVVESSQSASPQTGNPLQLMTIQFRAQKEGVHEAAVTEALQRQSGGLYSLDEADQPEIEWRVRESNWTYVGSEPWGVNHHMWRIEQVERIACELLRLGALALEPYDYTEEVLPDGGVRLAARALVSEVDLDAIARLMGPIEVVRVGVSDTPRRMRLSGYVWGERFEGLVVVVACADIREPRVTLAGFDGDPVDDFEDLIALGAVDADALRQRRHARRRVQNVDGWELMPAPTP
ncbi:MAG: hypothetical protein JO352_13865 [Chloroflexi bacterium]|nr:hypothetical protein [Chloroflexota bacterium]MBV9602454.1 hypothetical protein [Chloroflexota bacterium]